MSILKVTHRTTYRYGAPVEFGEHRWMFRPRDSQLQRLILAEWTITPEPSDAHLDPRRLQQPDRRGQLRSPGGRAQLRERHHPRAHAPDRPRTFAPTRPPAPGRSNTTRTPSPTSSPTATSTTPTPPSRPGPKSLVPYEGVVDTAAAPPQAHPRRARNLQLLAPHQPGHPAPRPHPRAQARHLPRLHAADDGGRPPPRLRRAVRDRLHLRSRPRRRPHPRQRRHPRLGPDLPPRRRLGRVRPHQRHHRHPGPDPRRRRPRPPPAPSR